MKSLKVGDRVQLKPGHYSPSPHNPSIGCKFECLGTLSDIRGHRQLDSPCYVKWDNGITNNYCLDQLIAAPENSSDPNILYRNRKMRRNKK